MIVTIDGPAGAGKSTAARALAERLGFEHLDTGAMYRAVTLLCLRGEVDLSDPTAVADVARTLQLRFEGGRVIANGADVTSDIRTTEVTNQSQHVAGNLEVRARLVELQRRIAQGRNLVTEGRDQGTVAFPDAECKFFITASPEQRALRRQRELASRGEYVSLEELLALQRGRDERDETRAVGALRPASDAVRIDTSTMPLEEMIERLVAMVEARRGGTVENASR